MAALNATLARTVVAAHTLDMQLRDIRTRLPTTGGQALAQVLSDAAAIMDRLPSRFGTSEQALPAMADVFTMAARRQAEQSRAVGPDDLLAIVHYRLERLFDWLAAYARASAAVLGRRDLLDGLPQSAFSPFRHYGLGLLGALRVMLIVPAAGFFWLLSGEPANSGILVICSVFVAFMAMCGTLTARSVASSSAFAWPFRWHRCSTSQSSPWRPTGSVSQLLCLGLVRLRLPACQPRIAGMPSVLPTC